MGVAEVVPAGYLSSVYPPSVWVLGTPGRVDSPVPTLPQMGGVIQNEGPPGEPYRTEQGDTVVHVSQLWKGQMVWN